VCLTNLHFTWWKPLLHITDHERDTSSVPPSNLDLVRSIYADWERGDFSRADWADPEIEMVRPESLDGDLLKGRTSAEGGWREWLTTWEDFRAEADDFRVLDQERVLVFGRMSGHGRASGALGETATVNLFHIRDGKVTRLVLYASRERALADLGLGD
jgi:ketosteroid isomerase-like protein